MQIFFSFCGPSPDKKSDFCWKKLKIFQKWRVCVPNSPIAALTSANQFFSQASASTNQMFYPRETTDFVLPELWIILYSWDSHCTSALSPNFRDFHRIPNDSKSRQSVIFPLNKSEVLRFVILMFGFEFRLEFDLDSISNFWIWLLIFGKRRCQQQRST